MSADTVKSTFRSIVKSRLLGKFPNTALPIDMDFETAPKAKVLSSILVMFVNHLQALACTSRIDGTFLRVSRAAWCPGI